LARALAARIVVGRLPHGPVMLCGTTTVLISTLLLGLGAGSSSASALGLPSAGVVTMTAPLEESLEQLLARMRRERDALRENLAGRVSYYIEELEGLASEPSERKLGTTRRALAALGPEAIPLLVDAIEPGVASGEAARFRAREVTLVLAEARPAAITDRLLELAATGSEEGSGNALEVLTTTPEPERVAQRLADLFESSQGKKRAKVLATLARLGGERAQAAVAAALVSEDDEVVTAALGALAESGGGEAAGAVLTLTRSARAPRYVESILTYFESVPNAMGQEQALALVNLAGHTALSEKLRVRLLESLARHSLELDTNLRRALEPISEGGTRLAREAALVLLLALGDSSSGRALFKPYDEAIKKRPDWANAHVERARIHYRVGDTKRAIKDYKRALELLAEARQFDSDTYVGVARCYALQGDFRKAAEALESAQIPLKVRRTLGHDPDFAEMVKSSRYGEVFYLDKE
jgi:hypothetical protein